VPRADRERHRALACLYAADRYHHVEREIRGHLEAGEVVISDRYIPSGLVMQRFDAVDPAFLWQLNAEAERPDLAVILDADPTVIAERLLARGAHNRFQLAPGSSHAEVHFYRQATERLIQAGFDVFRVDCNQRPPEQVATCIRDRLTAFFAATRASEAVMTTPAAEHFPPEVIQLLNLATRVINEHGLCAVCGSAWPCERAVVAERPW
jgi:dTMP kinase